jgi:exodeoxyribonuclease VII large subunit
LRAPTPSAAAELAVPDATEWLAAFARLALRLRRCMRRRLQEHGERLRWLTGRAALVSPAARLAQQAQRLDELEQCLSRAWERQQRGRRERLDWLIGRAALASPAARLRRAVERHAALFARLKAAELAQLRRLREHLLPLARTLNAVSPLATLERGYAIVRTQEGGILRDAAQVTPGTLIEARLARGRLRAKVEGP